MNVMSQKEIKQFITSVGTFSRSYLTTGAIPESSIAALMEQIKDKLPVNKQNIDTDLVRLVLAIYQTMDEVKINGGKTREQFHYEEKQRLNELIEKSDKRSAKPEDIKDKSFGGTNCD